MCKSGAWHGQPPERCAPVALHTARARALALKHSRCRRRRRVSRAGNKRRLRRVLGEEPEPEVGGVLPVLPLRAARGQLEACRVVSVPRGILLRQGELHGGALGPPTLADASSRRLLRTPRAGLGRVCASGRGSASLCGPMGRKALQVHIQCEPAEVLVLNPSASGKMMVPSSGGMPISLNLCRVRWTLFGSSGFSLCRPGPSYCPTPNPASPSPPGTRYNARSSGQWRGRRNLPGTSTSLPAVSAARSARQCQNA